MLPNSLKLLHVLQMCLLVDSKIFLCLICELLKYRMDYSKINNKSQFNLGKWILLCKKTKHE